MCCHKSRQENVRLLSHHSPLLQSWLQPELKLLMLQCSIVTLMQINLDTWLCYRSHSTSNIQFKCKLIIAFIIGHWVLSWVSSLSLLMEGLSPSVFSIQSYLLKQLSLRKHSLFYVCFTLVLRLLLLLLLRLSVALLMLTQTKNKVVMGATHLCSYI